jgi:hypothetical protein
MRPCRRDHGRAGRGDARDAPGAVEPRDVAPAVCSPRPCSRRARRCGRRGAAQRRAPGQCAPCRQARSPRREADGRSACDARSAKRLQVVRVSSRAGHERRDAAQRTRMTLRAARPAPGVRVRSRPPQRPAERQLSRAPADGWAGRSQPPCALRRQRVAADARAATPRADAGSPSATTRARTRGRRASTSQADRRARRQRRSHRVPQSRRTGFALTSHRPRTCPRRAPRPTQHAQPRPRQHVHRRRHPRRHRTPARASARENPTPRNRRAPAPRTDSGARKRNAGSKVPGAYSELRTGASSRAAPGACRRRRA